MILNIMADTKYIFSPLAFFFSYTEKNKYYQGKYQNEFVFVYKVPDT